jgi:hypothetical protein
MKRNLIVTCMATLILAGVVRGGVVYYDTDLIGQGDQDLVAFSFQTTNLNSTLPASSVEDGTTVYVLRSGSYISSTELSNVWSPDITLYTGDAFWIQGNNPAGRTYRIYGTLLTNVSFTMSFSSNQWYGVANPFLFTLPCYGGNFIECCEVTNPTVHQSLMYQANVGDVVYEWINYNQQWDSPFTRTNNYIWINQPSSQSPPLIEKHGILFKFAKASTWTFYNYNITTTHNSCLTSCP